MFGFNFSQIMTILAILAITILGTYFMIKKVAKGNRYIIASCYIVDFAIIYASGLFSFMLLIPYAVLFAFIFILFYLAIKKLKRGSKIKLSIISFSLGIILLTIGGFGLNFTKQQQYSTTDNIESTIQKNADIYQSNNEDKGDEIAIYTVSLWAGFAFTISGAIFLLGAGKRKIVCINSINGNSSNINLLSTLESLSTLKDKGVITEEEFDFKKKVILNKI